MSERRVPVDTPEYRRRLGEVLIESGAITRAQLEEALSNAGVVDDRRERLGQAVVRLGFAGPRAVARALAEQLGLEYFEGDILRPEPSAVGAVPAHIAERHRMVPLQWDPDGTLALATADPTNVVALDDIAVAAGSRVRPIVAAPSVVEAALRKVYGFDRRAGELIGAIDVDDAPIAADHNPNVADGPVLRLAEGVIFDAVGARASDIHVEPGAAQTVVRYRIDGVLNQVMAVPRAVTPQLISRLKLMAGMDVAERRRPQDGRARVKTAEGEVDLRVSTLPTMYGETLVIRLLRKGAERLHLRDIGFTDEQLATMESALERPQGLILLTGPTGAGKTSTLYAALGELAGEQRNVITIEDPVEYELPGVNQSQINDRIGLTFPKALRTVLRQDPDVVMVGEIRDPETADLALQASLTGHLVFSTLHTNDASGAVVRLRDLGVPPFIIASSLTLVVAQRLARRICSSCATPAAPTERQIAALHLSDRDVASGAFSVGTGCSACNHTGYRGRVGLFEVLHVDAKVRELLATDASESAIRHAARLGGMHSLREDGLRKALDGVTTLEEVLRVTKLDSSGEGLCPVCAETVEEDFSVCPWCAANLQPESCDSCHRSLAHGWRVCPTCGTSTERGAGERDRPRVLVVDDDPVARRVIGMMVRNDYDVVEAEDGRAALDAVQRERFDAVLLDVSMPDMDGYEITRQLRARPVTMHLPVVLVTASDDRETELTGLRAGADDYLTKPVDPDVLAARLAAVLRRVAA